MAAHIPDECLLARVHMYVLNTQVSPECVSDQQPGCCGGCRQISTASPSAWTAKVHGETTSSSSGCGAASNTRRCISGPTTACPRPANRLDAISTFTTAADLTRALTGARPIKFTSPRCPSAWQPNHGRRSTYRRGNTVQTTEATSV